MADAFAGENFREAVGGSAVLPRTGTGADVNVTTFDLLIEPGIARVREVIDGIVEIKIVVVHPVHEIPQVVDAGHREAALDDVGVLEEAVGGVVRAKRSAHRRDRNALCLTIVPNKRDDLFPQVRIKNDLDVAAMKRVRALVVKTLPIDRIHGEKFDSSGFDEIRERADHALALELPLVAGAGREAQERWAPMTEDGDAQLHAEPVRVPAVIFTFHRLPLGCYGEKRVCQRSGFRAISLPADRNVLRGSAYIICDI